MKMHSDLRGTGSVFRYTVQQHYKTRSVIIFLVILFVLALASLPVIVLTSGSGKADIETQITALYFRNETGFPLEFEEALTDTRWADITVAPTDLDDEALNKQLASEDTAAAAVITLDEKKMSFLIETRYGRGGKVTKTDVTALNAVLSDVLHQSLLHSLSVSEAQEATIRSKAASQISRISDYLRGTEETNADTHVYANLIYCYAIMLLNSISMGYVFHLCTEEKISKLVESMLVSVAPMAMLIGKMLAVTFFMFCGFALIGIGLLLSYLIAGVIGDISGIYATLVRVMQFDPADLHMTAGNILLMLLCILLTYAMIVSFSAIVGSCCSKTEDFQQGSLAVVLFIMIGYLSSAFAPMLESDAANITFSLIPLTSVFTLFPNYLCGKIGMPVLVTGMLIQAATTVLLMRLAGAVYKMMLLYRGGFPKPSQLFRMLRDYRQSAAAGKEKQRG